MKQAVSSTRSQEKDRNANFFGDGTVFKAKLIGILEVGEARGDRMCQEALQDLKMAIRAAGEHKQKITIHVTIEGLRLRDEKTGDSLYHHPVHKISFIAQDMTDSRAFGYIFGSPDSGHRFFGIKTDKAASQVVLAMRDLFQVVFELKKKEIELARQHIQNKITQHEHQQAIAALTNKSDPSTSSLYKNSEGKLTSKDKSPESVADLVDLEQELSSIQRGITQMERITPSEPTPKSLTDRDDPFGDSFISTPPIYNLLPPPPEASSKRNQKSSPTPKSDEPLAELAQVLSNSQAPLATDEDWLNTPPQSAASICDMHESISYGEDIVNSTNNTQDYRNLQLDVFTELDPLGTGKIRPYVDKKYFFQDLKNPPKKVLKELSQEIPSFDVYFGQDLNREYSGDRKQSRSEDFDKSFDPFQTEYDPFSGSIKSSDPFDCFPDSDPNSQDEAKVERNRSTPSSAALNGPRLQVSLPPEKTGNWDASPRPEKSDGTSPIPQGIVRNRPIASSRSSAMDFVNTLGTGKRSHFFDAGSRGHQDIETEAPEPPPRPDSVGNLEPPPLPPKKQFSDIVIRPSSAISNNNSSNNDSLRSDFMHERRSNQDDNAPPLPLPSRKVVSSRIHQKKLQEDDYLTPLSGDIPTLLPPPQKKDPLKVVRKSEKKPEPPSTDLAEMSVSRLLSLGIDELAKKLNVPVSKVSNMTLVELSMYLTDFIENSKKQQQQQQLQAIEKQSAIFKVNFDAASFGNESTFFAKFDDNFGEETDQKFVADFERFKDVKPEVPPPSADRYAVLREIIEQELQVQKRTPEPVEVEEKVEDKPVCVKKTLDFEKEVEAEISRLSPNLKVGNVEPIPRPLSKIDAKMSEALSQGKDRYAALRDIVLVEDLFDKPGAQDVFFDSSEDQAGEDYPEINILDDNMGIEPEKGGRDDLEINDYLQEAVSSMSLNREHLSPISKSPGFSQLPVQQNASTSPIKLQNTSKSPTLLDPGVHKMNDMSTSPIPIDKPVTPHKIPSPLSPKSLRTASPLRKDEIRDEQSKVRTESGSQSDVVSESSPETDDKVHRTKERAERSESNNNHSWAVFDGPTSPKHEKKETPKEPKRGNKGKVSPCSSEGKDDWKEEPEYGGSRRVKAAAHNTSSSSRDQSPWEEENSDFRRDRRDRYGYPPGRRAHRRKNSCDEDYDYPEYDRPQRRKEHPWSPPEDYDDFEPRSCWSPSEQEERRNFDRYERSPYAEPKSLNTYDRRDYSKYYDKRKYYRERNRMDFPYEEPYEDVHEPPVRGKRNNYENVYEFDRSSRDARRDHFYNKETRSFESTESFDSRGRPNSFGSGEIYGSYDREYRDRYVMEKNRLLKGRNARSKPDLEQDSDTEFGGRRERFESSSLQRGRPKPGEDKRSWKRPGSATEPGQRRLPPNVGAPPEPESEKDRRFRRKGRLMRKEDDYVSNYATMRYAPRRRDDYYDYDPEEDPYYSQYYKTAGPRLEGRSETSKDKRYDYPETDERRFKKSASREFFEPKERFAKFPEEKKHVRVEFDSPSKAGGNGKFNFEDVGFDSDFSPAFGTPQNNSKGFKFAADFEEKSRQNFAPSPSSRQTFAPSPSNRQNFANFENFPSPVPAPAPPSASKLRFNENVQVSKFDANTASSNMFEDNFSKTELDEKADQWNEMAAPPKMRQLRSPHENLKKSESVNIFVKKQDDPFEDDPFFGSSAASNQNNNINSKKSAGDNWNKNFANFDNNM